jgi:ATP phosphoribosyltransferase regulatory subunit
MGLTPRSLEAPLPAGMRDHLPPEAVVRRALVDRMLDRAGLWGYAPVEPPSFEFASVLERGLPGGEGADVLRFVEPESGEVAALRPDVTPQIARILATRMRHAAPPIRLMYVANVVRRAGSASAARREVAQFGVELAGPSGPLGDLELIGLADELLAREGLAGLTLDLGDALVLEELLGAVAHAARPALLAALDRRDARAVSDLAQVLPAGVAPALAALLALDDDPRALASARPILAPWTSSVRALERLESLVALARSAGLASRLRVDLTTLRGFSYYTGTTFQFFAAGADDALASGGRYDGLVARYGRELPSSGFAVDLERLARVGQPAPRRQPIRVAVVGEGAFLAGKRLREAGLVAVHGDAAHDVEAEFVVDAESFVRRSSGMRILSESPVDALLAHLRSAASEAALG